MTEIDTLLGGEVRAKLLRLFLFNPNVSLDAGTIENRTQASKKQVKADLAALHRMRFLKRRMGHVASPKTGKKKKMPVWMLNPQFPHLAALHTFFTSVTELSDAFLIDKMNKAGKLKLLVIGGAFLKDWDARIDLLIVGDDLKKGSLHHSLKSIEAEMGRELRYAHLTTADFNYRLSVYDKLLRDLLEYTHKVLIDKIGLPENMRPQFLSTSIGVAF
jgi:hypothetical protein